MGHMSYMWLLQLGRMKEGTGRGMTAGPRVPWPSGACGWTFSAAAQAGGTEQQSQAAAPDTPNSCASPF